MAKEDHWFKFYYRLIVLSTQGWKDDEFGAYVRLLIHQFDKGGLPDDPGEIAKLITTYKKNWPALSKKFKKSDDGLLRNDFMKGVRDEREKKKTVGAEFGKTGGRGNKKGTLSENKGNPLENEKVSISPSFSNSPSVGDQGGPGEQEEVRLSPNGFLAKDLDKAMVLTDLEIGTTIEYLRIKSKKVVDNREIVEQWEAFKIRTFGLVKWYNDRQELINHFRDSLKIELNNAKHSTSTGSGNGKPAGGKSAGANALLGKLQDEISAAGPGQ